MAIPLEESEVLARTSLELHHQMAHGDRSPKNVQVWYRENRHDPAFEVLACYLYLLPTLNYIFF